MSAWQPIETVPEFQRVLVYAPEWDAPHHLNDEVDEEGMVFEAVATPDGAFQDPCYYEWTGRGATHWMPLPLPPDSLTEAGREKLG